MKIERCSRLGLTQSNLYFKFASETVQFHCLGLIPFSGYLWAGQILLQHQFSLGRSGWVRQWRWNPTFLVPSRPKVRFSENQAPLIFWGQSSHEPQHCWHSLGSPYIKLSPRWKSDCGLKATFWLTIMDRVLSSSKTAKGNGHRDYARVRYSHCLAINCPQAERSCKEYEIVSKVCPGPPRSQVGVNT